MKNFFFFAEWQCVKPQIFKETLVRVVYWPEMGGGRERQCGAGHTSGTAYAARPSRTMKMKNSSYCHLCVSVSTLLRSYGIPLLRNYGIPLLRNY